MKESCVSEYHGVSMRESVCVNEDFILWFVHVCEGGVCETPKKRNEILPMHVCVRGALKSSAPFHDMNSQAQFSGFESSRENPSQRNYWGIQMQQLGPTKSP